MEEKEQSIDGDWENWNFRQCHTTITLTSGKPYSVSLNSSTIKHLLRASSMSGSRISCLGPSIRSFASKLVWQASRRDLWKRTPGALRRKAWLSLLGPWKWLHFPTHRRPQGLNQATGVSLWLNLPGLGNLFVLQFPHLKMGKIIVPILQCIMRIPLVYKYKQQRIGVGT